VLHFRDSALTIVRSLFFVCFFCFGGGQITQTKEAKLPPIDHLNHWYTQKKKELPTEAAELKLEMESQVRCP
jgi:hypothetical protein